MRKSTHSPEGKSLCTVLRELREKAGLTQREVARRLKREHSMVERLEGGQRRIDVVEFCWYCEAMGVQPERAFGVFMDALRVTDAYQNERRQLMQAAESREPYRAPKRKPPAEG